MTHEAATAACPVADVLLVRVQGRLGLNVVEWLATLPLQYAGPGIPVLLGGVQRQRQ